MPLLRNVPKPARLTTPRLRSRWVRPVPGVPSVTFSATLGFAGSSNRAVSSRRAATLAFVGSTPRRITRAMSAVLAFLGSQSGATLMIREEQDAANNTGAVQFTLGAGSTAGDTVLLVCVNDFYVLANLLTPTGTAVTSWTLRHSLDGGTNDTHVKVWEGAVTTPGGTVVTAWGTAAPDEERYAAMFVFPHATYDGAASTDADTTATAHVAPSVTPISGAVDDTLVTVWGTDSTGVINYTAIPGSMTGYAERDVGTFMTCKAASEQLFAGTATGTRTATADTLRNWFGVSVLMKRSTGGTLTPVALSAVLTFTGALPRRTARVLAATLAFVATLGRAVGSRQSARQSFTGTTARQTVRALAAAAVGFAGAQSRLVAAARAASLALTGARAVAVTKSQAATLAFTGATTRAFSRTQAATLAFAGSVAKRTSTAKAAALSFFGRALRGALLTEDTTANIPNPERGMFQYTETHYLSDNSGYVALSSSTLASDATTLGRSLVFRYFVMEKYLTVDAIDTAYLNLVAADIAACRTAGVKLIPRFVYSTSGDTVAPYGDAPTVARIVGHLKQLLPVITAGADVIPFLEAGFIGMWGEWFYTDNFGDLGTVTEAQWMDRKAVLSYLLSADSRVQVLLRYAGLKDKYLNGSNNVASLTDAFASQDAAKWSGYGTGVVATSGQLRISPSVSGTYIGITSAATTWDLVGHGVQVEVPTRLNLGNGTTEQFLQINAPDFNNRLSIGISGSSLVMRYIVGGVTSDTTVTYNATNHRWWRLREVAGTAFWETSLTGAAGSWTVQRTATHALTVCSGASVRIEAGFYGTEPTPGTAAFDNLSTDYLPPADAPTRLGFHNDAFLASTDDFGTYSTFSSMTVAATRAYVAAQTALPLPNGGESAATNGTSSEFPEASIELAANHFTFLNPIYNPDVLTQWGSSGQAEAALRLGYRLVGLAVETPVTVLQGATMHVEVALSNNGYAYPLTARDVVIVLDDQAGHRYEYVTGVDIRTWGPGSDTLVADMPVSGTAPSGVYHVAVWMPDQTSGLRSRPEYAIRLANVGTWNATTGYNDLASVTVGTPAILRTLSATLGFTVTTTRRVAHGLAAALSFTGTSPRRAIASQQSAQLSFVGALRRATGTKLAGAAVGFTGARSRLIGTAKAATLAFTGTRSVAVAKPQSAQLSFVGATTRRMARTLIAALPFTGTRTARTARAMTAAVSFTGSVTTAAVHFFTQALSATLGFAGALPRVTRKVTAAVLAFTGTQIRGTGKAQASQLAFTGSQARRTGSGQAATVGFVGSIRRGIAHTFAAALAFTGTLGTAAVHFFTQALSATLSFVGATSRRTGKPLPAALAFTGSQQRQAARTLPAGLAFVGSQTRRTASRQVAALAFAGATTRRITKSAFVAALGFAGSLTTRLMHLFAQAFTAALGFVAAMSTIRPPSWKASMFDAGAAAVGEREPGPGAVSATDQGGTSISGTG